MSMTKEHFDQLSADLLFMSETDAPLDYFELDPEKSNQWPPSTGGHFLELVGEDSGTKVEELAPEKFFTDLRQGNEDSEEHVATLEKAMTDELRNLAGFRVGEIEIEIYVLGKDDSGNVCGLKTLSVET